MKELQQVVSEKIESMIESGAVEKIIEENLEKTVKESVKSALRSYGDFGEFLTEKVKEAIGACKNDISLPLYNTFIANAVHEAYGSTLEEHALSSFKELIGDLLEPTPKLSKFSNVTRLIEECWMGGSEEGIIEVEAEENGDGDALYVTIKHPEYDWENIKITFYSFRKETWHIGYLRAGDEPLSQAPKQYARDSFGVTRLSDELFKFYLAGTEFEADDNFDTIYREY